MFRNAVSKLSLRKKLTILAIVGVLLPLLGLTYLQYRSLKELRNKTKGEFKDNLRQGLTVVELRMKQRLQDLAAQTLDPIDSIDLSSPGAAAEIEKHFTNIKRTHPEIDEIFVFVFSGEQRKPTTQAYLYSDKFVKIDQVTSTPPQSIVLFYFEKTQQMSQSALDDNRKYLFADQSCLACPRNMREGKFLYYPLQRLNPRQQSSSMLRTGFAGVLLTERFINDELIEGSINAVAASHTPVMAVTISDEDQRLLYSNGTPQNEYLLKTNFGRPFSSWKAAVGLKNTNIDELARNSFLHSAGATVLVLLFLLGGIALTLRAADREARLAQAKSNFVANVSHELKTPLSLLSLFSEILELGRVKNEEKKIEYYRVIRHESQRLNKMIDNILDFSKIEAGRKTYNFAPSDMSEVIENVLSSYRYQIVNSGFDIETKLQPELPPVLIDRDAMAQAISNLLDNAIKYSRDEKRLSITTERRGSDLFIEIADRGIGIPRAEQAKVFEKFYRVGNGLVHDVKGSGLGLSLVKHIIDAHKGSIAVESDAGKGTRFTIRLPLSQ